MSMKSPEVSSTSSHARGPRPLSITCVSPPGRGANPRSKPLIELLELGLGALLHVVEERVAVRVDADGERTEVLHSKLPEALGHELLPGDLFDLLDLRRLERRRSADDREIDHPEALHRLDRLVGKTALAADRAHAVLLSQALREPHHPRGGRRADADLLVLAGTELADARGRVQQERTAEVHRRRDPLVEDPDLCAIADADDVAVDGHLVTGAEVANRLLARRKMHANRGHLTHVPKSWGQTLAVRAVATAVSVRTHGRTPPLRSRRRARLRAARPSTGS